MITVFGHLQEQLTFNPCVSVVFNGGFFGGSVTYKLCGSSKTSTLTLGANQNSFQLCLDNYSWTFSNTNMTASLQGPCSSGGGPVTDNAFTIERNTDGYSTYAQYNSSYVVNDIVNVSNDVECYEIMGTAVVSDPSIFPTITGLCGVSGGGPKGGDGIGPI